MAEELRLGKRQLRAACDAWESGGCLGLGLWLTRHKQHHSVADYSELVALVRVELNDTVDYAAPPWRGGQTKTREV